MVQDLDAAVRKQGTSDEFGIADAQRRTSTVDRKVLFHSVARDLDQPNRPPL